MRRSWKALFALFASGGAIFNTAALSAEAYPARPITMVVGFQAGGPADTTARILADRMQKSLGQRVIIENVTGASGSIAGARVARADPDGYTLLFGNWATNVLNGAIYELKYDLLSDFAPVSLVVSEPMLILGRKGLPAGNLRELIAWLRDHPGNASAGTGGGGSIAHVVGIFFEQKTHSHFSFIPYRGLAPAMQDLIAERIDLIFNDTANALPQVRAGNAKAYAVTARERLKGAPDIPTVDEAGLPGFYVSNWRAIWAPKSTPTEIVEKLNSAAVEALADPAVRERIEAVGQTIFPREQETPEALATLNGAEIRKWWPLIKAAHIKAQ
jgi:tripartite-type tricarboxylate transporter receptor subunit TctC